ncbi:MAG: Rho termination factor N-terminal domain-containing protein [Candidatus Thermoplasmatota archaeon]
MTPSAEASVAERLEARLNEMRARDLQDLAKDHGVEVRGRRKRADLISAIVESPKAAEILRALDREKVPSPEAERLRQELAATRDSIREASNLGASVGAAEEVWMAAVESLDRGGYEEAGELLERAARRTTEARERRIREIEDTLSSIEDHIALARNVGADVGEAEKLQAQARTAVSAREYAEAGDLVKRAERAAMVGQQKQILRAIQLRESQVERAHAVIASCEPLLQEAESYGLSVSEVRTLLRQARDVLSKGDYVAGMTFARNAEEAAYRLEAHIEEERRRRGIVRPAPGLCGVCRSDRLTFYDDGWGRCGKCGTSFRWRGPLGIRERLRGLLGT